MRNASIARNLAAFTLSTLTAFGALTAEPAEAQAGGQPTVHIREGWLRGVRADGVDRFMGIPYAAPPVGDLRWKPPAAAPSWRGTRSAETPPPRCVQFNVAGEEDCLYLNVYVPSRPRRAGRLPVIFYIHGGGLKVGSSIDNDPSRIAATTDSVVVMFNYRLGQFGFLAHPALGREAGDGTSGEYGLMDQQAALRWVHQRISAFGGDPKNITIAGGSAGAWSVCAHLVSPHVSGLFSRAAFQSGGCVSKPLADAEASGIGFATAVGCPDTSSAACLRQKSAAELIATDSWAQETLLVSGGRLLAEPTATAVDAGRFHHVPIIVGGTENEFRGGSAGLFPMAEADYLAFLSDTFGELKDRILEVYPTAAYSDPYYALISVVNDSGIGQGGACFDQKFAAKLATRVPTFMYEFSDSTAPVPSWLVVPEGFEVGASHGSDEVYWFDRPGDPIAPLNASQRWLAHQMIQYLGGFAEHGAPKAWYQPQWPRFEGKHKRVMSFGTNSVGVRTDVDDNHHCDFWSSIGF